MQKVFDEVNSLDKRCYEEFALSEDILMEHASNSMATYIKENFEKGSSILIVCGSGNNGADGITLARLLQNSYDINLYLHSEPNTEIGKLQLKRALSIGVTVSSEIKPCDVVVDCLFGSGLNKPLRDDAIDLINKLNSLEVQKIACDIPSGVNNQGQVNETAFEADITFTMGALKISLFTDVAKEYVGEIKVCDLGIDSSIYQTSSNTYLLEVSDMKLPFRNKKNTHKGSFGHLNVIVGAKDGAAKLTAEAGFVFGAGLVTLINHEEHMVKEFLMQSHFVSENCTAIAIGMGLGKFNDKEIKEILEKPIAKVIDADLFYSELILDVLADEVVLTPHPKEFVSLLKLSNIADISVEELQNNRFKYLKEFCSKYPKVVLLLKGANVLIGQNENIYINTFGTSVLAKGGSGDVLSGFIASLLAQGYSCLEASISGSLAHSLVAKNYSKNSYSFTPFDLIQGVKEL